MRRTRLFSIIIAVAIGVAGWWMWPGYQTANTPLNLSVELFEEARWSELGDPVTVTITETLGRQNPFAAFLSQPNEVLRDEERLKTVENIRFGLQKFYDARGEYPVGSGTSVGTDQAKCLSALGWMTQLACAIPSNPAANVQYLRNLPADPGLFVYSYTALEDESKYEVRFKLETDAALGVVGEYVATVEGIRPVK